MIRTENVSLQIEHCNKCININTRNALCLNFKEIGLEYINNLPKKINIMFLAESPPLPGTGFFYDPNSTNNQFRDKLFSLINQSDLGTVISIDDFTNKGYYLADSIKCRWDKSINKYINRPILKNCSDYLVEEIKQLKPKNIIVMGKTSEYSTSIRNVREIIQNLIIRLTYIPFILTASNETDADKIKKLSKINLDDN